MKAKLTYANPVLALVRNSRGWYSVAYVVESEGQLYAYKWLQGQLRNQHESKANAKASGVPMLRGVYERGRGLNEINLVPRGVV